MKNNILANTVCIVLSIVLVLCGVFCGLISFMCIAIATNVIGLIIGVGLCLASIGLIVLSIIEIKDVIQGHGKFCY